jgi:hypothetical protein
MRMMNERTGELIGHLSDISTGGFKLETKNPIRENQEFLLRMDLTNEVSNQDHLVFSARSRWCQRHPIDPTLYNIGFEILNMSAGDLDIFVRVFEKYGTQARNKNKKDNADYLWR